LEFSEETLDQVAFFVENEVAFPFVFAIALWRNDDGDLRVAQLFDQGVCIVAFVVEQRAASDAFEQLPGSATIVDVTARENKPDRIAESVGERMDFACQTEPPDPNQPLQEWVIEPIGESCTFVPRVGHDCSYGA